MPEWTTSGRKVTAYLSDGEVVVGWILFEDRRFILLSLDPRHEHVRMLRRPAVRALDRSQVRDQWIEPFVGEEVVAELAAFDDRVGAAARAAFDHLDIGRLRRLALSYKKARELATHADRAEVGHPPTWDYLSLTASAELVEELQASGLLTLVQEHAPYLGSLVHVETLPGADADWADSDDQLGDLIKGARRQPQAVREVDQQLVRQGLRAWSRRDSARWVDGLGDVVLGGGFAAANVTAGALAGVFASLPTLGIGTVATTVGVVTSTYTGLIRLKDGLTTLIEGPTAKED